MTAVGFPLGEHGRLGNSLFQLAATVGVARRLDLSIRVDEDWPYIPFLSLPEEWIGKGRYVDTRSYVGGSHWRQTYLQDPSLWSHCADEIREAFAPSPRARAVLDSLPTPGPTDVAVHVRRTDYLDFPDHLPTLPAVYYGRCRGGLSRLLGVSFWDGLSFHVYGDDPEWAKASLLGWETYRYGGDADEPTDWADLFQMARYRHHIIANSSFSWWAAYLSGDDHAVCPSPWFGPKIDVPSPALASWLTVRWQEQEWG